MEKYVFDTNSLLKLQSYSNDVFTSLWDEIEKLISQSRFISTREVLNELESYKDDNYIVKWGKNNSLFEQPSKDEIKILRDEIFSVKHFRTSIKPKKIKKGKPVADPFLIAKAKVEDGILITEERYRRNSVQIPNICNSLGVECTNLDGMMEKEGWEF
ncbi:MAG: DUF4411 family protein [Candidatus Woesearchaeota archaeon]